jgi:hypothetical protein
MPLSSWQLTSFNLKGEIVLGEERFGLIKIYRSDDGMVALLGNDDAILSGPGKPIRLDFAAPDPILGFTLDTGIRRTKALTKGNGFYFGSHMLRPTLTRPITQDDFNARRFAWLTDAINNGFQHTDKIKVTDAIRCHHLLEAYNDALLMHAQFASESYLALLRIIEAVVGSSGGRPFAFGSAQISRALNAHVLMKLRTVDAYKERIDQATGLFAAESTKPDLKQHTAAISGFDDAAKVVFACMLSAYRYRNKFMHIGFPFPSTVTETVGAADDSGMTYLHPSTGLKWPRYLRHEGLEINDLIDMHEHIEPSEMQAFQETYFHLLPTWHFLKTYAREALVKKVEALGGPRP